MAGVLSETDRCEFLTGRPITLCHIAVSTKRVSMRLPTGYYRQEWASAVRQK